MMMDDVTTISHRWLCPPAAECAFLAVGLRCWRCLNIQVGGRSRIRVGVYGKSEDTFLWLTASSVPNSKNKPGF